MGLTLINDLIDTIIKNKHKLNWELSVCDSFLISTENIGIRITFCTEVSYKLYITNNRNNIEIEHNYKYKKLKEIFLSNDLLIQQAIDEIEKS